MLGGGNQVPAATDGNSEPTRRPRGGTSSPTVPQASRGEPYGKTKIVSTRDFAEFARPPAVHETSGFQAVWPGTPRTRSGWFPIPHPLPLRSSPTPPSAHTPPRPSSRLFPPREWAQGFQTADSKPRSLAHSFGRTHCLGGTRPARHEPDLPVQQRTDSANRSFPVWFQGLEHACLRGRSPLVSVVDGLAGVLVFPVVSLAGPEVICRDGSPPSGDCLGDGLD
jgi:hypothetical protein